jgi:uncharacterized protein
VVLGSPPGGRSAWRERLEEDLGAIDREAWEGLDHPTPQLSYDWLRARSRTIKGRPRFAFVSTAGGSPVVGVAAYLVDGASHPGYDPALVLAAQDLPAADVVEEPGARPALAALRAALREPVDRVHPALVVAAPGRSPGISYGSGLDRDARRMAAEMAAEAVERQAAADAAPLICWLYLLDGQDDVLDEVLRDRGYLRAVVDADCYLPVAWDSFDGYLASFKAQRRRGIRREMAALTAAGVRVDLRGADALGPDLVRLELQWRHKYQRSATYEDTLADHAELRRHMASGLRVFVASRAGRPLGFSVFLERDRTWHGRFGGFDYANRPLFLYFNLLFYHPLRAALERHVTCIRYSLKSYEEKRSRGCSLQHVLVYVRPPRALAKTMSSGLEVIDRSQRQRFARIAALHTRHV